jgi:shikimate 5-dehydrogenase/3-dehydroquinate dehydratase
VQLVVTIFERSRDGALAAMRALGSDHDMVEVRVDAFGGGSLEAFRDASTKPILFTNRGGEPVDVDFGLIDVELGRTVRDPKRTVLSFHDFERVPDLEPLIASMQGCAYAKIAVTPHSLRENERLLDLQRPGLSLFGMGERGLYSRILAPFFGSELAFVSVNEERTAAPGQISLAKALKIYGAPAVRRPYRRRPAGVFAIVGDPAGHSLSPTIHNHLFRERGVDAAYTIASVERFEEVIEPFEAKRLTGMAVTAPFKDAAFAYATKVGASIGTNAAEARAVNTLVNTPSGVIADNTDVDGFEMLLRGKKGNRGAVIGAGGTGRAAEIALRRAGFDVTVFNRTPREGARPLDEAAKFRADVVINTLPKGVNAALNATIVAAYTGPEGSGYELLQAQAIRQNALFLKAFA